MIQIAPLQGHTDAAWRHWHNEIYGGGNLYFTPFIRAEHGEMRSRDLRDVTSPLNDSLRLEPQVIFRDMAELDLLLSALAETGVREANLNMGCPFPPQTSKGRGAGFIPNLEEAAKLKETVRKYPGISLSVKMRLGYKDADEWRGILPILNELPLRFIALHPRIARQQYGGQLDLGQFGDFLRESNAPVVFNGEIKTPEDAAAVYERFPGIAGIMLGRGLLARPSLAAEIAGGKEWTPAERIAGMKDFHHELLAHYEKVLCGDSQILSKIQPFWEFAEPEIGHKAWKAIRKASTLPKYKSALIF